jgi:putative transposase
LANFIVYSPSALSRCLVSRRVGGSAGLPHSVDELHTLWYICAMQRTIRLLLEASPPQADALAETSRQFTAVFNAVCAQAWHEQLSNSLKLHHATYYSLKADFPALVSDLHIQARVKATEAVKSALALRKAGRTVSQPRSQHCPPRYNHHTFRVDWHSRTVRLSLVGGRQTVRFRIPQYGAKYIGYPPDTADLLQRDGRWYLQVVVTVPRPDVVPTDQVVGVALGLSRPAVTSTNRFLGKRAWKALEGRLFKLKRALQKRGTKSAKRHLRKVRHKQMRFRRNVDQILSKQIVQSVEPGGTIVLENLKDIRRRARMRRKTETQRRIHSWSFARLKNFIEYKAEERGCMVVAVDPRHTSQTCSRCGHTARNNRRSRAVFVCRSCGYSLHADLNGARNIAAKYRAEGGTSAFGGLPVNQPTVSDLTRRRSG